MSLQVFPLIVPFVPGAVRTLHCVDPLGDPHKCVFCGMDRRRQGFYFVDTPDLWLLAQSEGVMGLWFEHTKSVEPFSTCVKAQQPQGVIHADPTSVQ